MAKKVPVDDKLGYNRFNTDESYAHIEIDPEFKDEEEIRKVVLACPAELYKYENGGIRRKSRQDLEPSFWRCRRDLHAGLSGDDPVLKRS